MENTFLNKLRKIFTLSRKVTRAVAYILLVLIISILTYFTYSKYEETIVNQQHQIMLNISRSIVRSIELFISDVQDSMKIVTLDKEFVKDVLNVEKGDTGEELYDKLKAYYDAEDKSIDAIYVINKNGQIIGQYPKNIFSIDHNLKEDINSAISKKATTIGKTYMDKNKGYFILNIFEPVYEDEKFIGMIGVSISLDVINSRLINPVRVGEKGYAMVKDENGIIIMHTVKEQVGMDVIESRKQVYPGLDYSELEKLIEKQLKGEEGTAVYHSYWWDDKNPKRVKKLNAYTPVHLGEHFWIIAQTMSYDEIQEPINKFLVKIVGIAMLITVFLVLFISTIVKMRKNKEELIKETKYLKRLNEKSEQLRKKEAELYHSHKLKMIGTLTGGIAHDINNLLTPILGYSELLLMKLPLNSEYYEEVDEIYRASQKGKDLIDQILLFSRNENGIVKVEPIDINRVVRETIKLVEAVLPKNVVIKEDIDENIGCISANYTQIHQVIFNLCTNAYQAVKNNKGEIEVSLKKVSDEGIDKADSQKSGSGKHVEITIKDTGCGMDEETKSRIFEPFFTTKEIGEGTGLGLFVVQSIIEKYEGTINVESEIGKGSTFKVCLPLIDGKPVIQKNESIGEHLICNKRILIVDDNEEILKMLKKSLEHAGYEVVTEKSSLRALGIFRWHSNNFDLIITDYMMPDMKGFELASEIREIRENIKIILITGYMDENEKSIRDIAQFDGCIAKPIELNDLLELIKKVFSQRV